MPNRTLNFDYYQLKIRDDDTTPLGTILSKNVQFKPVIFPTGPISVYQQFEIKPLYILGTLVHAQMYELPPIYEPATARMTPLQIKEDQGLAHACSFLFDRKLNILMFESKRGAVPIGSFCTYLEQTFGIKAIDVVLVLDPEKEQLFKKMVVMSRFEFKVAKTESGNLFYDKKNSVSKMIKAADGTNASVIEVAWSARRRDSLDMRGIRTWVTDLRKYRSSNKKNAELKKLVVVGRNEMDGERLVIDFIANRMRTAIDVEMKRLSTDFELKEKINKMEAEYLKVQPSLIKAYG